MRLLAAGLVLITSIGLGQTQSTLPMEPLVAAALEKADPEAVYTLMLAPDLDHEARRVLEANSREAVPYETFSSRGGVPPAGILLVESVKLPAAGAGTSNSETRSVAADIDLWLGEPPGLGTSDPPRDTLPSIAYGSLSCGIRWRMRFEWRAPDQTWELVWGRDTGEPKPRSRMIQC